MRRPAIRIILAPLKRYNSKANRQRDIPLYGMQQGRTIYIDPRTENPISTFKHELLHLEHPDWTEQKVEIEEIRWWKESTWKQKAELLILLGRAELKHPKEVIG